MADAYDLLRPGANVRLRDDVYATNEGNIPVKRFMRIASIHRDESTGTYEVKGAVFHFSRNMKGKFPKKLNEVVRTLGEDIVRPEDIVGPVNIVLTNMPFPQGRNLDEDGWYCCRYINDVYDRKRKEYGILRRVTEEEADDGFKMDDAVLRAQWRAHGMKKRGRDEFEDVDGGDDFEMFDSNPKRPAFLGASSSSSPPSLSSGTKLSVGSTPTLSSQSSLSNTRASSLDLELVEITKTSFKTRSPKKSRPSSTANSRASSLEILEPPKPASPSKSTSRSFKLGKHRYTYGDAFCGGGGASLGAHTAGLRIKWAFDKDRDARAVYSCNFPNVDFYHLEAADFIRFNGAEQVDVVHLSPPCQPFSPAHTIEGKNDEINQASVFAIRDVLNNIRPRFATLEETFGLMDERHSDYFYAVLHMFTDLGWSVAYKCFNAMEYGLPQNRKRLFIMAASPGETLPPFPEPTHYDIRNPVEGLLPPQTLGQCLSTVHSHSPDHEDSFKLWPHPRAVPKGCSLDLPFNYTIRAGGGEYDIHPSGLRPFSIREVAAIQGFPMDFLFPQMSKTGKVKIVGNAVPPVLGRAMFLEIVKHMKRVDKERRKEVEERRRRWRRGEGGGGGDGRAGR